MYFQKQLNCGKKYIGMNKVTQFVSYEKMSKYVANIIEDIFKKSFRMSFPKLVLPTGSTPLGLYEELVKRQLDWSNITTFNLDEYIINPNHLQSYYNFMRMNLFDKTNIYPNSYNFPDRNTQAYEDKIEEHGGIIYAKSNTPEFGAGGNTFNDVFGATLNPWDLTKSVAGSSGGSAAALASGTAWLAHGSDFGGSLRNPASFCGVVGLRPSPGRVANGPRPLPFQNLGVQGPMARNIADTALFLDAMVGFAPLEPFSLPTPKNSFFKASQERRKPRKVAFSPTLGFMPVHAEVKEIFLQAALKFEKQGVIVEEAHPDLEKVIETFWILRSHLFAISMGEMARKNPDKLKPELLENIEAGFKISNQELIGAEITRGQIYNTMANFFEEFDLLLAPATIVPPFPIGQRYVENCSGTNFSNYVEWLGISFPATLGSCPAISLPAGTTILGLPVGIQLIGPNQGEANLLSAAQILEDLIGRSPTPISPREEPKSTE